MLGQLQNKMNLIYNEGKKNDELLFEKNQEINIEYFYNEWLKTFKEEKYKKDLVYCSFINVKTIIELDEIKNIIIKLIPNAKANLFRD